jgi:hypothetical protein
MMEEAKGISSQKAATLRTVWPLFSCLTPNADAFITSNATAWQALMQSLAAGWKIRSLKG